MEESITSIFNFKKSGKCKSGWGTNLALNYFPDIPIRSLTIMAMLLPCGLLKKTLIHICWSKLILLSRMSVVNRSM